MEAHQLKIMPKANDIWSGIGGHFDSLGQIINEFVDNSVSNFIGNNTLERHIKIYLTEKRVQGEKNYRVEVKIEDTGTGIKNLASAFTLGCRSNQETPLNEHGFGLKHALASANPENDSWCVRTRTEDNLKANKFIEISAPYEFEIKVKELGSEHWEGSKTGTIVSFECSYEMYSTLVRSYSIKGGMRDFKKIAALLYEELAFVYAGIIVDGKAFITLIVTPADEQGTPYPVGALTPDWIGNYGLGESSCIEDLGNGPVEIKYHFGKFEGKDDNQDYGFVNNKSKKHYKNSMSSSGVEIRINGRLICYNLFKEIWGKDKHNSYNSFLITLDLKAKDKKALPKTRTSKNGIREDDAQLAKLYEWIRSRMPEPPTSDSETENEVDMFRKLCENIDRFDQRTANKLLTTEQKVFLTGNKKDSIRIDLYQVIDNEVTIYEGKKWDTSAKDVYQLRMYWDGLIYDGITPNVGILVGNDHPETVKELISRVNQMQDYNGNNYNFICKTWSDYGITPTGEDKSKGKK